MHKVIAVALLLVLGTSAQFRTLNGFNGYNLNGFNGLRGLSYGGGLGLSYGGGLGLSYGGLGGLSYGNAGGFGGLSYGNAGGLFLGNNAYSRLNIGVAPQYINALAAPQYAIAAPQPQIIRLAAPQPQFVAAAPQIIAAPAPQIIAAPAPQIFAAPQILAPQAPQILAPQPIPRVAELEGPPTPYSFAYGTDDAQGTQTSRQEQSDGRTVTGSYGYTDADGVGRVVEYIADENGFRANVRTNEPGVGRNPAIGDPAATNWEILPTPPGVMERYLNRNAFFQNIQPQLQTIALQQPNYALAPQVQTVVVNSDAAGYGLGGYSGLSGIGGLGGIITTGSLLRAK